MLASRAPGARSYAPPSRCPSLAGTPSIPWGRDGTCCTLTLTAWPRSHPWRRRGLGLAVEARHHRVSWTPAPVPCCTSRRGSPGACSPACRSGPIVSTPTRSGERESAC
eukprot:scaffold41472_cov32-Phaeocystis_antarctica.AAC.2